MALGKNEISGIKGVKSGEIASVTLPGGRDGFVYHTALPRIWHKAVPEAMTRADMLTEIDTIALKAGSKYLWPAMPIATYLATQANFYGLAAVDGMLPVGFSPVYMEEESDQRELALGTLDTGDVNIEIKFNSTVVSPTMEATALYYIEPNKPLGQFTTFVTDNYEYTGAGGEFTIKDLSLDGPKGTGIKAMHISSTAFSAADFSVSTAQGTEIPVWRGRTDVDDYLMDHKTFQTGGRSPQAGFTHLDLAGNFLGDVHSMDNWGNHKLKLTMTGADTFQIITEKVSPAFIDRGI